MPTSDRCSLFCKETPLKFGAVFFLHIKTCSSIFYPVAYKGGIILSATGYIQPRAFTSKAQIPLEDVAISVTTLDGTVIAMRLTDRNGLTQPIELPVPDLSESQTPDPEDTPFARVNLYARLRGYEQIEIEDLQIFADTTTDQPLEMIPLSELPESWGKREVFIIPPQNL